MQGPTEDKAVKVGVNPRDAKPESENKHVGAYKKERATHWREGQGLRARWCS